MPNTCKLESGDYHIRPLLADKPQFLGVAPRPREELASPLGDPVVVRDPGIVGNTFKVTKIPLGDKCVYMIQVIKQSGEHGVLESTRAERDRNDVVGVYAYTQRPPQEWVITHMENDAYTIVQCELLGPKVNYAWTAPREPPKTREEQIQLKILSQPPSKNQLYRFEPVKRAD